MVSARLVQGAFYRTVLVALLAVVTLGVLSACGAEKGAEKSSAQSSFRTWEEIEKSGTIRIGVFSDKAPFGYVDADGKFAGYDVEYGNQIGKDFSLKVEYVPVEAASRVEFVDTGKVDLILANFTVTEERKRKVDFLDPYLKVSLGVVSPDQALVASPGDLDGKTVIVVKGTTAETYVEKHFPSVTVQKYEQYTEATNALLDGRGDAWITDNTEALAWANQTKGFTAGITQLGDVDTIAGAVAKGNSSVATALNEHLQSVGEKNFFHANYEKTLKPVYGDQVSADELVIEGGKF